MKRPTPLRLAIAAGPLIATLAWSTAASAALGGALPLVSAVRPDLSSVTLVAGSTVAFCFDKALSQSAPLHRTDFMLGGYRARGDSSTSSNTAFAPAAVTYDQSNRSCVDAAFPSHTPAGASIDYSQYSYGSVASAAVQVPGGQHNDADSTILIGSTSRAGTTGVTVAPNLIGVAPGTGHATLAYVFDKNLGGVAVAPGSGFFVIDSAGDVCRQTSPGSIAFTANVVMVTFPAAPTPDCPVPPAGGVAGAARAGLDSLTVTDATVGQQTEANIAPEAVVAPGSSGTTARPDLVSAALSADGSTLAYNFDQPVGSAAASKFEVILSDDGAQTGTSAVVSNTASTGTVTVSLAGGSTFNEYDVRAVVLPGGVVGSKSGLANVDGSVPIGGNAGGFSRGFTSGPDAFSVAWSRTTGVATVTFDQRVFANPGTKFSPIAAGFVLLDANGTPVRNGSGQSINVASAPAGPMQIGVQFTASAITAAKALEICGPPDDLGTIGPPLECQSAGADGGSVWTSAAGAAPEAPNVQQILSPSVTAAALEDISTGRVTWRHARRAAPGRAR